jgi:hypothetical protein
LAVAHPPLARAHWDVLIALGFAIGSACFFIGPFPGVVELVGQGADGVIFFAGSVFFTSAAALELREATLRLGRWATNPSWWSAAIQFAGTLLFNLNTYDAMRDGLSAEQENRLVFAPDLFGSACFLASGVLAYLAATGPEHRMAAVNLAGCVLFGISAIASYVVPSTGSVLDLAAVNWCTALGALCFFVGALMLLPRKSTVLKEA